MLATNEIDVIVIGSGAGGSAATYRLVRAGLRVLLVEKGMPLPNDGSTLDVQRVIHDAATWHWSGARRGRGTSRSRRIVLEARRCHCRRGYRQSAVLSASRISDARDRTRRVLGSCWVRTRPDDRRNRAPRSSLARSRALLKRTNTGGGARLRCDSRMNEDATMERSLTNEGQPA